MPGPLRGGGARAVHPAPPRAGGTARGGTGARASRPRRALRPGVTGGV
jgi:hypothetical protein